MRRRIATLGVFLLLGTGPTIGTAGPVVEDVAFEPLREHCTRLLKALDDLKAPLPAETAKELKAVLKDGAKDPEAAEKVQKLLDAHCLVRVTINPESRVKAARGAAPAELRRDQEVVVLVKVQNEAGVTHALTVSGPQVAVSGKKGEGRWLEAAVYAGPPLGKKLSGARVEYVLLRLTAREAGKREATLAFDVGQGTQDLGFRAEVPILFAVRAK